MHVMDVFFGPLWTGANPSSGSLDVVQQPQRARMCGFGDKVRLSFWAGDFGLSDGTVG